MVNFLWTKPVDLITEPHCTWLLGFLWLEVVFLSPLQLEGEEFAKVQRWD